MKINMLDLFRKKMIFKKKYPRSSFDVLPECNNLYPLLISLENENVYAYSTRFMIKTNDLPEIENIITSCFHGGTEQLKECMFYKGKTLHYYKFREFNQIIIDITTNSGELIKKIWDGKFEPPAPDIVFPNEDFESLGNLQGKMELWWDVYWFPFWVSLSEEDKRNYLERNNISNELREFLILHN
ncbi:hypothetical protein GQP67_004661 [Salmonella enterica]|nr:hypothetical protein [Salmonella enterica]